MSRLVPRFVPRSRPASVAARLGTVLRAVSFWSAVVLPFSAVLLLATVGDARPLLVVGLLAVNAVVLVAGHGYRAGES